MHKHTLLSTLLLCAAAGSATAATTLVTADPNWSQHTAFDRTPRRIVETDNAVYFFVHQRAFDQNDNYFRLYRYPSGGVFVLDKNNPGTLKDLHREVPMTSNSVVTFEVDTQTEALAFTYTDGGIDIVTPDRRVFNFDNISKRIFPGASTINHTSFDPIRRLFWFSTGSGFLAISTDNFKVTYEAPWSNNVSDINSVGDRVIAIIDGVVCQADGSAPLQRRSSFTEIPGLALTGTPMRILPLDANNFAVPTLSGRVYFVTRNEAGTWTSRQVVNNAAILLPEYTWIKKPTEIVRYQYAEDRLEHTCTPTAQGWLVSTVDRAYLLNRPASESAQATCREVSYPATQDRWVSTHDGETFWFYRHRGNFASATYNGTTWSAFSEPIRPEAPLATDDAHFLYSANHGLLCVNYSNGDYSAANYYRLPTLISGYKNGKWNNLSPVYHTPAYAATNTTFAGALKGKLERWPVADPRGMVIDPVYPDYLWVGSAGDGIAAINLADLSAMPLSTVPPNHWLATGNYPANQSLPKCTWGTYTVCDILGADAEGNIWAQYFVPWPAVDQSSQINLYLMYLTPEGRREAIETGDPTRLDWQTFHYPLYYYGNFKSYGKLLTHPNNAGIIVSSFNSTEGYTRYLYFYDTNSTPADTSDDNWFAVRTALTPDGAKNTFSVVNDIVEDPRTGAIYIISPNGVWVIDDIRAIDLSQAPEAGPMRRLTAKTPDGFDSELLAPMIASKACFDEYGRLWVATVTSGAVCIDPQTEQLVAHYNTANSPLPANACYGIGWNPATKSLFISTEFGTAEVKPDAPAVVRNELQQPFVKPESVTPDYTGTVTVRNVPDGVSLSVLDADGRELAVLPLPVCGVTHWDLRDATGARVPAGIYRFADKSRTTALPTLILVVAD